MTPSDREPYEPPKIERRDPVGDPLVGGAAPSGLT